MGPPLSSTCGDQVSCHDQGPLRRAPQTTFAGHRAPSPAIATARTIRYTGRLLAGVASGAAGLGNRRFVVIVTEDGAHAAREVQVGTTIEISGHTIVLTHLGKLYFADAGLTKADVVDYYRNIADVMLPHVKDRPVSMKRYPQGAGGQSWFQKRVPDHFPEWIETTILSTADGGEIEQVVINDAATLVYLANQACLTPHIWLSTTQQIRRPDKMVFDLDPNQGATFDDVRFAAHRIRDELRDRDIRARVMTTGSRGLHVVVRLERRHEFDDVRAYARELAETLAERHPDKLTTKQRKADRGDRVFLDYLRNAYAQTSVAPYALRAQPSAPVATPVEWDELDEPDFGPQRWTLTNIFDRLKERGDPWADLEPPARLRMPSDG